MEQLSFQGVLKIVCFSNSDTFYKVLAVEIVDDDFEFVSDDIKVTGIFGEMQEGEVYEFFGQIVHHPKYGEQFKCERYEHAKPSTEDSLVKYFASDRFPGIGQKTAQKMIDSLGLDIIEQIHHNPDVLEVVPGLSAKKRQMIADGIKANYGMEQTIFRLMNLGLSNNLSFQLYQLYNEETLDILVANPYEAIFEIKGYTFKDADKLAERFELAYNSKDRIQAAILDILTKLCYESGNTYLDLDLVLLEAKKLLAFHFVDDVNYDDISEQILQLVQDKKVVIIEKQIALDYFAKAEQSIANDIKRLLPKEPKKFSDKEVTKAFLTVEKSLGMQYDDTQKEAIKKALSSSFFVLTGGPGTGKTTIINGLVQLYAKLHQYSLDINDYKDKSSFPFYLAAPTGRAAKRMSETTGLKAVTIHRLLGLGHDDVETVDVALEHGLLIVDEFSMVDTQLAAQLLSAVSGDVQVVFVGDKDQLPSVAPGQVLADLLSVTNIPHLKLTNIYRQGAESTIIPLAHEICEGKYTSSFTQKYNDRNFFSSDAYHIEEMIQKIVESAKNKGYSPQDVQVLAPMYKGIAGIDKLNEMMQNLFNPSHPRKAEFTFNKGVYRLGDKVLQLVNEPENNVFNGDMGVIVGMIPATESEDNIDELIVDFDDNEVVYQRNDWHKITLAYCCSIHKSQGSEFPVVILPMVSQYAQQLLKRNLLYTAITRSREKLIMLGEENVFKTCVERASDERKTRLVQQFFDSEQQEIIVDKPILTMELIERNSIPAMIGMDGITPYDFL